MSVIMSVFNSRKRNPRTVPGNEDCAAHFSTDQRHGGAHLSLHFMGAAFAIEKVSRFPLAFVLALFWLFAAANVRASLVATCGLFFGCSDRFALIVRHFQVSSVLFASTPDRTSILHPHDVS
jgi:hypothetical protein